MPDSFRRFSYWLLVLAILAVSVAAALWGGFELGRRQATETLRPELETLIVQRLALTEERDRLREALTAAQREQVIQERSHQIDREAARALTDRLKQAQDDRLALNRELSYLKRLVQEGGGGAMRIQDLRLATTDDPLAYAYHFTVTQIIPGFGESEGKVRVEIQGRDAEGTSTYDLSKLPSAEPRQLEFKFEHFQTLSGTFELPSDFDPETISIAVDPVSDRLMPTVQSFPWEPIGTDEIDARLSRDRDAERPKGELSDQPGA